MAARIVSPQIVFSPYLQAAAPFDGRTEAAYAKYLDAQNHDRDLYEQEQVSTERFLKRHQSVWMYFPHVELLFLLFAYQGASAAEARMIYSGCFPLVVMGVCALVRDAAGWCVGCILFSVRCRVCGSPLFFCGKVE